MSVKNWYWLWGFLVLGNVSILSALEAAQQDAAAIEGSSRTRRHGAGETPEIRAEPMQEKWFKKLKDQGSIARRTTAFDILFDENDDYKVPSPFDLEDAAELLFDSAFIESVQQSDVQSTQFLRGIREEFLELIKRSSRAEAVALFKKEWPEFVKRS